MGRFNKSHKYLQDNDLDALRKRDIWAKLGKPKVRL